MIQSSRESQTGSIVLAVDDDPVSRRVLESSLTRAGYEVVAEKSAESAQTAFERIGPGGIGCVVTDYRMPGLNGVDLRSWIWLQDPSISAILVTAEGEQKLVEQSLRAGFADFLNKPLSVPDLLKAVDTAMQTTRQRRQVAEMEKHVEQVARTQRQLLNSQLRGGMLSMDLYARPKFQAGGDFFSHIQSSPAEEFVVMADVSGHDLSAAYTSAYFQGMVRGMLECQASLDQVFQKFNCFLAEEWTPESDGSAASISAAALRFDRLRGEVSAVSCGAPMPQFVGQDGRARPLCRTRSFPLGWFSENPIERTSLPISPGHYLLWTDGVDELAEQLNVSSLSLTYALLAAGHNGIPLPCTSEADDDIMAARIRLRDQQNDHEPRSQYHALLAERYTQRDRERIDTFQQFWTNSLWLAIPSASEASIYDALLCTREALLNALNYGCRPEESASLDISFNPATSRIRVHVSDPGPGHDFDPGIHSQTAAGELADAHRGLLLIRALSTELAIRKRGAELIMEFSTDTSLS